MRLSQVSLHFRDNSDNDVIVAITRQEMYLSPYGSNPEGIVTTKMASVANKVASVFGWRPFFVDIDQEEEY